MISDSADVSRLPGGGISSAGPVDPAKPLPVLAKLPDNAGWTAAAERATLSYRTTVDGAWQGERAEALLAPANAVQIQVQRPARIRPPWTSSEVGGPHRAEWVRATPVLTNRRRCRSRSG
jgi:hypothetical protein